MLRKSLFCAHDGTISPEVFIEQLKKSETYWYWKIQKQIFPKECHCLKNSLPAKSPLIALSRVFDETSELIRLQFADLPYETKHQIIFPAKHSIVDKLIAHTHEENACH